MKKIKLYWDELTSDLSVKFIIMTAVVSLALISVAGITGFNVPKSDNVVSARLEALHQKDVEYTEINGEYTTLASETDRLKSDLTEKEKSLEEFSTSQNVLDKINSENEELEKEKNQLQSEVSSKQNTLNALEGQAKASSQAKVTLSSGTYKVGESIKSGKFLVTGSGSITISSSGTARVNTSLTSDGKEYTLNDGDLIKINGKAQFIPN